MKMESGGGGGGGGDADDVLFDEDDSARFVVARNINSGSNNSTSGKKSSTTQFSSGRRKTQINTETGEFINTESENRRRTNKSTGMSDRKPQSTPERIAHFYYTLGLLCSSHPVLILVITTTVVALSW